MVKLSKNVWKLQWVRKVKKAEPEYKWLWQAPQTETLGSICEGQAQFPQNWDSKNGSSAYSTKR